MEKGKLYTITFLRNIKYSLFSDPFIVVFNKIETAFQDFTYYLLMRHQLYDHNFTQVHPSLRAIKAMWQRNK
ncbi:hypothetical protein DN752_04205 [Echinicola strongylocentroti]|uniref:Uncharacterized protein n=1 Tax=Echinicola strongylocentroti TaxID=1795355 RepID=A0A2Z4IF55_9BACT|nr:hypothetical protein DN752_04205 [Echinicola strongylocentroti]